MARGVSCDPVNFRYGSVLESATDLSVSGPTFSWSQGRSYNSLTTGTTQLGTQWLDTNTQYKLIQSGASDVALVADASSKQVFTYSGGNYIAPYDAMLSLVHNGDATFTLTDLTSGEVSIFYDFSSSHKGLLKERTTRQWQYQGQYQGQPLKRDGTLYTYNASDQITQITSPEGQSYNIVFTYTSGNITKIEVRTGADTSTRVQEVNYTYFTSGTHSADVGQAGHLVQVKRMSLRSSGSPGTSADWIARYTQYRYGSNGLVKAVYEADAIQRILDNTSLNVSSADAILTKGDDYDNSGSSSHKVKEYASRAFTYYTADLLTNNSGATKCLTTWDPTNGENLQSKYGGSNVNEVADSKYLVKSETVGGCSSCGGGVAVKHDYYYMDISHGDQTGQAHNEVVRLVVEDTSDSGGNAVWRKVYGLNEPGGKLREAQITDVTGTPQFWCHSTTLVNDTGAKLHRIEQRRTPAAHNVTTSTIDEFLNPYDRTGGWTNDSNTLNSSAGRIDVFEYNSDGNQSAQRVKQGSSGSAYYVSASDYMGGSNANRKGLITDSYEYPTATTDRADGSRVQTQYEYTFWTDTDTVKTKTTTLPAISADQNGSATSVTTTEYFDNVGRLRWKQDGLGYVTYYSYHPKFGGSAYTLRDGVPGSLPSSADSNSTKWVTSTDGSASSNQPSRGGGLPTALEQVSRAEFDSQGRQTLAAMEDGTTDTVVSKTYTVYNTAVTYVFPYWDDSTSLPLLPIEVTAVNNAGVVTERYDVEASRAASSGGVPTGFTSGTGRSNVVRWVHYAYDAFTGKLSGLYRYHVIPASGYGTKDTNYAETAYGYDAMGRQARVVSPVGTITRTVFDALGRESSSWVGTDDVPSSGTWSPSNNSGANMVKVAQLEYDGGNAGGNGNRTKVINYLTDDQESNASVTLLKYDWRDRLVFTVDAEEFDGKATYSRVELDNQGHATKTERYYDANDNGSFPTDGTVDSGDRLLARSETLYDSLGRVYRTKKYAVTPSDGTVGNALVSDTWYDAAGRAIKQQAGNTFAKTLYDGLGRTTNQYTGYDTDETSYADADDVTGDTILQQSKVAYDASGNVIQTTQYARKHTTSDTGELSTSNARATYAATWYDGANRATAAADFGTNGGSAFSRPSSAPASSDTVLVTTTEYNTAGLAYKTIDPAGKEARQEFDPAGRVTKTTQNYTDGDPATGTADQDVTVERTYNSDGALLTLTAKNPTTGDQITRYVYGTDVGGITPYTYRNGLLRSEIYPDSDDTTSLGNGSDGVYDRVDLEYNIQGNLLKRKDQNGTVHEYVLDKSGRRLHDRVTTVGTGVDSAVLRISTTYDIRGLGEKITSYDNATVGSGNVLNEVVFEHDDLGNLAKDYQEHSGAKGANTLYVQYNRDTTAVSSIFTKGLRPTSTRYPNGRLVHTTYGTSGSSEDVINRPAAINDDNSGSPGNAVVEYTYLGLGQVVKVGYPQASLRLDLDSGTAGEYAGLDHFGRVVDQLWRDYGRSADAVRIQHGYDRVGNRLWRQDPVAIAASANLEDLYTYDGVNQLKHRDRGALNANKDAVTPKNFAEDWTLDMTGNWPTFKQDTDGNGTWDLDQSRTHDKANEVTQIDSSDTHVGEDRSGNMTKLPKPDNWSAHFDLTYDAWNRLVKVADGATIVATYAYDGRNFRARKTVSGSTRHYYYSSEWQVLEERVGSSTYADRQSVWGHRYIDDLMLRDRDADANTGTGNLGVTGSGLEERLYCLQDPNWNAAAICGADGAIQERYAYSAYGQPACLTSTFGSQPSSNYSWDILYTGRELNGEAGLYYYRNRYYDEKLGRFLSRDPIAYKGGINLYEYVSDSPLMYSDPSGLDRRLVCLNGHGYLVVDLYDKCCRKIGETQLHFSIMGCDVLPGDGGGTVLCTVKSTCQEDRILLDEWTKYSKAWWPCFTYNPIWQCWTASLCFLPPDRDRPKPPFKHMAAACFSEGTLVLCASGPRPIESIRAGDSVLAYDPESGAMTETLVRQVDMHEGRFTGILLQLSASETIDVVNGHPIFVGSQWTTPEAITEGDAVFTVVAGMKRVSVDTSPQHGSRRVYHLRTECGTYLVGRSGLVVSGRTAGDRMPTNTGM